jgi:hypothetical protein
VVTPRAQEAAIYWPGRRGVKDRRAAGRSDISICDGSLAHVATTEARRPDFIGCSKFAPELS